MNTIHIELPGIEAKLDRIIELLEKATTHNCESCVNTATCYVAEALQGAQSEVETPTETTEANDEHPVTDDLPWAEAPAPEQPTIKHADVQKKVVELRGQEDKRDAAKEIVLAYGKSVSGIPADKLPEVWDKLIALEG